MIEGPFHSCCQEWPGTQADAFSCCIITFISFNTHVIQGFKRPDLIDISLFMYKFAIEMCVDEYMAGIVQT